MKKLKDYCKDDDEKLPLYIALALAPAWEMLDDLAKENDKLKRRVAKLEKK